MIVGTSIKNKDASANFAVNFFYLELPDCQ